MKISIYAPPPPPAPVPVVNQLCLRLVTGYGDRIQLIAVNPETGVKLDGGVLMTFARDGTFKRANSIRAPGTGIQTDATGRMVESAGYGS